MLYPVDFVPRKSRNLGVGGAKSLKTTYSANIVAINS